MSCIRAYFARMELSDLKTALLVQSHGSIAGAARAMDVNPSSISRSLAALESRLGIRLFHRTTRSLALTDEGARYLHRVAPLLDELDAAQDEIAAKAQTPAGQLRMTASVAFSEKVLVPALARFRDLYPGISVDLLSDDRNVDLAEHGIDLAIRLSPSPKGDLISTKLMATRYRVVASADYLGAAGTIAHPRDLMGHNSLRFALPGVPNQWRFKDGEGAETVVPVDGALRISNALVLRNAALSGMGVAMLADWLVGEDIEAGRLVDVLPDHLCTATEFETAAWLLYPNRKYLPQKVRVMIDHLKVSVSSPERN